MKNELYKQYGLLLEDILDYFGIKAKRSFAKKELHASLKELYGINSLRELTEEELRLFILQIHVVFSTEFGITLNRAGEYRDIRKIGMKKLLKETNDKFKKQGKRLRKED